MKPGQQGEHHEHHRDASRGSRQRWATGDAAPAYTTETLVGFRAVDAVAAARDAATQRRMVKAAEVLMVFVVLMLGFSAFRAYAQAETWEQAQAKAMRGDYQAQRNVAFGYSTYSYKGQDKNPMLACAWRIVILKSGSQRVGQTDIGNFEAECGSLPDVQKDVALEQARTLFKRVYGKDMR